jgi:hypothetical protein
LGGNDICHTHRVRACSRAVTAVEDNRPGIDVFELDVSCAGTGVDLNVAG